MRTGNELAATAIRSFRDKDTEAVFRQEYVKAYQRIAGVARPLRSTSMNRTHRNRIPFPHPGETIREDYLKPLGMSVNRLARYFSSTPKFWLNLQTSYDLAVAEEARSEEIAKTVHPREAA